MYITFYKTIQTKIKETADNSIESFLLGLAPIMFRKNTYIEGPYKKVTLNIEKENLRKLFNKNKKPQWEIFPEHPGYPTTELSQHYNSFKIPKKSGGLRQIDAPDDELKSYLSKMKDYIEIVLSVLPHDSAHAYVKTRSTLTDLKKHQENESKWFLKLDFHKFFPSHTKQYVLDTLETIYPFGFLMEDETYKANLSEALDYAFLNNSLPQGTPLSPTLTNILMMGIDFDIQHMCWNERSNMIYTRYADDLTISSPYKFDYEKIKTNVIKIIEYHKAPFSLSLDKTRFGSSSGRNWNLGLMLNKDNRITLGHKQNQRLRAMINNIMNDFKHGITWSPEDRYEVGGKIAYWKAVDKEYAETVIKRYEQKYQISLKYVLQGPQVTANTNITYSLSSEP